MKKFLDVYIPILLSVILSIFTYVLLNEKYDLIVIISFIGVILGTCILLLISFRMRYTYFEIIICIFYILFFIIAPVIQLGKGYYPIPFPINVEYILIANICNMIFIVSYTMFRYTSVKKYKSQERNVKKFNINKSTKYIISLLFLIFFIPKLPSIINNIISRSGYIDTESKMIGLIVGKFIMFIPLMFVFYYIIEYIEKKDKRILFILFNWIFILILCKNPFNEKRNGLGPIYGSIIMFFIYRKINPRNFFILATVVFTIAFPLTSVITHSKLGISELLLQWSDIFSIDIVIDQFSQMHFDAFELLNVTIDYMNHNDINLGRQFLGAILFFIPRGMWINKPLNTGMLMGNYLINDYGFHYNNLSCPITAEAYINGGIIGVILFALIMSMWSKLVYKLLNHKNYYTLIGWYMCIHLFFLLRGDLTNGIAYIIGPLLALVFIPKMINRYYK